jgi:hypothetical protein
MVLLGVILVLLAAAAGVVLFAGTAQLTDTVDIDVLGGTLSLPPLTLLVTGMVVISIFWLGWALLRGGLRRSKRRRVEAKEAAAAAEARRVEEERRLKEEFAVRERQLLDDRRRREGESVAVGHDPDPRADDVRVEQGRHSADPTYRGTTPGAGPDDPAHRTDATEARDAGGHVGHDRDGRPI